MAKKRAASASKSADLSIGEMAEWLTQNVPELNEAFTRADIELALDDRGWITPGRNWTAADLDAPTRTTLVAKSRLYWLRDPMAKQAVRLWTDYALGNGISYTAQDEGQQKKLDLFVKNRRNKRLMSSQGQRRSSNKLLVDGEVFLAIFAEGEDKTIRYIDPLQITDVISDPDDDEHILGYKRITAQNKTLYYADWASDDDDVAMFEQQKDPADKTSIAGKIEKNVVVYHIPFDSMLKRGNGLLFPVVDWSKEHRRFMEARVAITSALSKFANKIKVKGGQGIVNKIVDQMQSSYAKAGMTMVEKNPQPAPGGAWVQNEGIDLTPMPRSTGAGDAKDDSNQLKLMVAAGTGIMLHYFGDPSTGNLATATAMELPMLKMFQSYQQLWMDAYRDIFAIVLDEDVDQEADVIDIDLPPILADDLQKLGSFLTAAASMFPEIKVPEVLQMMLISLGVNNIAEVMKSIEAQREKNDAEKAALLKQQQANPVGTPGAPGAGGPVPEAVVAESDTRKLLAAIQALTEKL